MRNTVSLSPASARARRILTLAMPLLLAACAASTTPPGQAPPSRPSGQAEPPRTYKPPTTGFIKPRVMRMRGLEGVIGATSGSLTRMFGSPVLDVKEGDARKLQFGGRPCVLDVYLYPMEPGGEPKATYVDARRESDGRDVNRPSCVEALKR